MNTQQMPTINPGEESLAKIENKNNLSRFGNVLRNEKPKLKEIYNLRNIYSAINF